MKLSFLIFILSASVQAQLPPFDPALCTEHLEGEGLTPVMLGAPISRNGAYSSQMYAPVQVLACTHSYNNIYRFYPSDRVVTSCTALAQQDPAWHLVTGYTCSGSGISQN